MVNIAPDQDRGTPGRPGGHRARCPPAFRNAARSGLGRPRASPPLGFYADDDNTLIGSEIDIATLFADRSV